MTNVILLLLEVIGRGIGGNLDVNEDLVVEKERQNEEAKKESKSAVEDVKRINIKEKEKENRNKKRDTFEGKKSEGEGETTIERPSIPSFTLSER
jgi:hypothetical protein